MSLTRDIMVTYRGPGKVVRRLLAMGRSEMFALSIVMVACVVVFIGQWPKLSREAFISGDTIYISLYGSFIALIFMMPLVLYALAALSYGVTRVFGGHGSMFGARLALFWAFLAASPLLLLHGLVAGFIGEGEQLNAVGVVWILMFMWFWLAGLREAAWGKS